jgi:hypothetical protein
MRPERRRAGKRGRALVHEASPLGCAGQEGGGGTEISTVPRIRLSSLMGYASRG